MLTDINCYLGKYILYFCQIIQAPIAFRYVHLIDEDEDEHANDHSEDDHGSICYLFICLNVDVNKVGSGGSSFVE